MKKLMDIDGHKALITLDPETQLFRGDFVGLNGGADLYAADAASLQREGRTSLKVFLDMRREDAVEPRRGGAAPA